MRNLTKALTIAALSAAIFATPGALAQKSDAKGMAGEAMNADHFVKMCDTDKDGMVSKAEMMKMVEKAWAKADAKKAGKIDKKQAEFFLQELMRSGA
jgi:hypothetical protein